MSIKRFTKLAVAAMVAAVLSFGVVGCGEDDDDSGGGGGGGGGDVPVAGVTVAPSSATVAVGGTQGFTATVSPGNATNKSVTWSSNDVSVATVSAAGVVTGVSAGTATITARTADGNKTASATVTVTGGSDPVLPDPTPGSRDSRLVLPDGYAWADNGRTGDREGVIFKSNGTMQFVDDYLGYWRVDDDYPSVTWSTTGNNTLTLVAVGYGTTSAQYTVTGTTLTLTDEDGDVEVYTRTQVNLP